MFALLNPPTLARPARSAPCRAERPGRRVADRQCPESKFQERRTGFGVVVCRVGSEEEKAGPEDAARVAEGVRGLPREKAPRSGALHALRDVARHGERLG